MQFDPKIVKAMAQGICPTFYVTPWDQTSEFRQGLCRDMATAALTALCAARPDVAALLASPCAKEGSK